MPSLDETLVSAIQESGARGADISDLIRTLSTGTEDSIRKRASELTKSGVLERVSRGRYRIPEYLNQVRINEAGPSYATEIVPLTPRALALVESLQEVVTFDLFHEVAAGHGLDALIFDERSRISVTLPLAFCHQFLGFRPPAMMGVSEVTGDSMWPALQDGDLVLYSLSPDIDATGLHVLNYDGRMVCKRVQPVGRGYRIISENRLAGYIPELIRLTGEGYVHDETGDLIEFGIVGKILFPRPETARVQTEHLAHLLKQMFSEAASA